jgi:aryl-alcohol dehydrogenase-like predicted oxidoreductase
MLYRTLGRTGLEVSELGFGAWGIGGTGWIGADDDESLRALRVAIEHGVNFLDTAYGYGDGHSERLVGAAVRESGETVYVASKVPPKNERWPAPSGVRAEEAFTADWIVSCTERSLQNLGLETIDVQQFHVWSDEWVGQGDWLDGIERLKRDGKIRFFGVSINDHQPENAIRLVESGLVDTVQVIYNIFDQSPEDVLFPTVRAAHVGVIVRVPLDEGALTGSIRPETTFPKGDFRDRYFAAERRREVWERVQAIAGDVDVEVDQLAEIALRFCLSHPAANVVIPGMRSTRNVERNLRAASAGPLEESQLTRLRRHRWVVDFY